MFKNLRALVAKILIRNSGYNLVSEDRVLEQEFKKMYAICRPYTMTSIERMYALYTSVNYIIDNDIPGDFIECGVYKGGSSMMMALILRNKAITNRKIFLYDTFEGMSMPTEVDAKSDGVSSQTLEQWKENQTQISNNWCYSSVDEVSKNMEITSLPKEQFELVKGKVEDTIPNNFHNQIALLRLDTDWYESTKHELEHLYPLLVNSGVIIIDDYGAWEGARLAVNEYFGEKKKILLNRIDYTGRIAIKNN
jgi:hypothetical protein